MNAHALATTALTPVDDYLVFTQAKIKLATYDGIEVDPSEVNPALSLHQKAVVIWALRGGRRAIFLAFGLGKTVIQIEIMRLLKKHCPGLYLVVLPLNVRREFFNDAKTFFTGDYAVNLKFIRTNEEFDDAVDLHITNYEPVRDGKLDPTVCTGVSLDEAAVLRSYGSETFQTFLPLFAGVRFKFVATATPSPNRFKELIHYSGFLGVMDTGQALTRFFQRDSEKAGNLTLYPHMEDAFWMWMHSWACFVQRPSDLGFSDEGYIRPERKVNWHEVPSDHSAATAERDGQGVLFANANMSLPAAAKEKRSSIDTRIAKMLEIINADPDSHRIIWHDLEDERRAIEAALPGVRSIFGSQDLELREGYVDDFKEGRITNLAAKPVMLAAGGNLQKNCHKEIFLGVGHKFHDFIQAIMRVDRFGQFFTVEIDIIHTEAEREIVRDLKAKWARDDEMRAKMSEIIRKYGLNHAEMFEVLKRTIGIERTVVEGNRFKIANNDCVLEARLTADNSVGQIITSIPFANHYEYTPCYEDFGHTEDNAHFWTQMGFLSKELLRILQPGRLMCVHVKDRINFGNVTGYGRPTVSPFHAEAILHFINAGFWYMGMITVTTDVVTENNGTYRLSWSENAKDSTKMGVGGPEYVLLFCKPQSNRAKGYSDVPVTKKMPNAVQADGSVGAWKRGLQPIKKTGYSRAQWQVDAHAHWRSSGSRFLDPEELAKLDPKKIPRAYKEFSENNVYDFDHHVDLGEALDEADRLSAKYMTLAPASSHEDVWTDVVRMRTLNGQQVQRNVEKHICPLQFDIVDRLIDRYSNPDDIVYDPFGGLGTVPFCAIKKGRRGQMSELSAAYTGDAVHYCRAAEAGQEVQFLDAHALPDNDADSAPEGEVA